VGAKFSAPVQTGPGAHPASCTMGTGAFPGDKERPGRDADPSPPSSAVGHERIELYIYSPYGSYGLYKASVSVQGCTLPFFHNNTKWTIISTCSVRVINDYAYIKQVCTLISYTYVYKQSKHSCISLHTFHFSENVLHILKLHEAELG